MRQRRWGSAAAAGCALLGAGGRRHSGNERGPRRVRPRPDRPHLPCVPRAWPAVAALEQAVEREAVVSLKILHGGDELSGSSSVSAKSGRLAEVGEGVRFARRSLHGVQVPDAQRVIRVATCRIPLALVGSMSRSRTPSPSVVRGRSAPSMDRVHADLEAARRPSRAVEHEG